MSRPVALKPITAVGFMALALLGCTSNGSERPYMTAHVKSANPIEIDRAMARYDANPQDLAALIKLSQTLRKAGRHEEALTYLSQAKEKFSNSPEFLAEYGRAKLVAGNAKDARELLRQAIDSGDHEWQTYSALGVASDLMRKHDEATRAYGRALESCPESASILNNMGLSTAFSGDVNGAIALLSRAQKLQPSSLRIAQNLIVLKDARNSCGNCTAEEYRKVVSSVYSSDWPGAKGELSCGSGQLTALEIEDALTDKSFIDMKVNFAFDSAELMPDAKEALDELAKAMMSANLSPYRFRLEGHTDATGTDAYNQTLSERRAAAVAAYLESAHGIAGERLETYGFGESALLDASRPYDGVNRRVRIIKIDANQTATNSQ